MQAKAEKFPDVTAEDYLDYIMTLQHEDLARIYVMLSDMLIVEQNEFRASNIMIIQNTVDGIGKIKFGAMYIVALDAIL